MNSSQQSGQCTGRLFGCFFTWYHKKSLPLLSQQSGARCSGSDLRHGGTVDLSTPLRAFLVSPISPVGGFGSETDFYQRQAAKRREVCTWAQGRLMVVELAIRRVSIAGNGTVDSELSEACARVVNETAKPISLRAIGAACLGRSKPSKKLLEVLKQLAGQAVIHQWPSYRRSQIFGNRSLRSAVEDAFVAALEDAPLTVPGAAKPVSKIIGQVSEESVLAELRGVAPKLASARKIVQIAVGRQSVIYMSVPYLGRVVPATPTKSAEQSCVFQAIVITNSRRT